MSEIRCKLFGMPQILKDGQPVFFPYAKIYALLYYILVSKVVTRDEAAGLLWPDENSEVARRNLRNTIYQAKKILGEDIILSPKKSILMINEDLDIEVDVDLFLKDPQEQLHLYTGEFLQGFFLKDSEAYEFWLIRMRNLYKGKFSSESLRKIEDRLQNHLYDKTEEMIQHLIKIDEYDERGFRLLMRLYRETGRNGKAIETYYELGKVLRQELGVSPDQTTRNLYEQALKEMQIGAGQSRSDEEIFFYGRYQILASLEKVLKEFKEKEEDSKAILIMGESGSGRSTIKRRLLENAADDVWVLEATCFPSQQNMFLRPWCAIARQIMALAQESGALPPALWGEMMRSVFPDFQENLPAADFLTAEKPVNLSFVAQVFSEALKALAQKRQTLLAFEDLQWMDADSLRLLSGILLEVPANQVSMLATVNQERGQALEETLTCLERSGRIFSVTLERFSAEECHYLIEKSFPDHKATGKLMERIYNETEGTPFFLSEYISMMRSGQELDALSPAIRSFLRARFFNLSQDALGLARVLSYFYDAVPLPFVAKVMERSEEMLTEPLQNLKERGVVIEREGAMLAFTHGKLREYLYRSQADSRKRLMHQKIACLMEKSSQSDGRYKHYEQLSYHFAEAGDQLNALKYKMANLSRHLSIFHEFFPIASAEELESDQGYYISSDKIKTLFHNIEASLETLPKTTGRSEELERLEVEFFYLKGRYSVMEGDYESGIKDISYVIKMSQQNGQMAYTFEGYKQMIYYYFQINDAKGMAKYIEPALDLAVRCNDHWQIGVLLRLKGLYFMMTGRYHMAEDLFRASIGTFNVTEQTAKNYVVNIAAAYDYIGEIYSIQGEFDRAIEMFDQAILMCPSNALSSLALFNIDAGKTLCFMDDYRAAKERFEKAYSLYGRSDFFWLWSTLDAFMALALVEDGEPERALQYLNTAEQNVWRMRYPGDRGSVHFAQAVIRIRMEETPSVRAVFREVLTEPAEHYGQLALKYLDPYLNRYEIQRLQNMLREAGSKSNE